MSSLAAINLSRLLGRRPATDDEFAAYERSQQPGAPANFAGMVLPNPNGIKVSDDTESGVEPTRLPVGVSFKHDNFVGPMHTDLMSTAPLFDMSKAQPISAGASGSSAPLFDMSKAKALNAPPEPSGFWDTLGREGKAMTGSISGLPAAVYHAFADPATKDEADKFGGQDQVSGAKRVGLGIHRLATAPVETAVDWYSDAMRGKIPNAYEQALSVAPEALGSASGSVIAGKLTEGAPAAARTVIEKTPAVVRAGARATNAVLEKAPGSVGAAAGAAAGHATGIPGASTIGAGVGYAVGKELLPTVRIPGEGFGLPDRVTGGPATIPPESTPAPTAAASPASPAASQTAVAATPPSGAGVPRTLSGESSLRQILTGQDNANLLKIAKSRGINVAQESQLKPGVADNRIINKIIDDFSDDELDGVRSQYLETKLHGKHNFGEIGPEAWKTMGLQTYFPDVKIPQATLRRTQGAIASAGAPSESAAAAAETPAKAPAAAAPAEDDLTAQMQKSIDLAKSKGGVFTSAEPSMLTKRWGVNAESIADTDANLRGKSPAESQAYIDQLAEAYKKGQKVEPVVETRDAENNLIEVDGRHRALAAAKAGVDRIPVIVRRLQAVQ